MNWFTKTNTAGASSEAKKLHVDNWGGCEHVETDHNLLHIVQYENDSFGREGYCLCKECFDKNQEAEDNEEVVCSDCKGTFKKIDTIRWTWYDFYVAQGDEPLCICKECRGKPKHVSRVARDKADHDAEFPDDNDD